MHIRVLTTMVLLNWWTCGCGGGSDSSPATEAAAGFFADASARLVPPFSHNPAVEGKYEMFENIGSGGGLVDIDNDGDLDIILLNGAWRDSAAANAPLPNRLYRQEGDGRFVEISEAAGLGDSGYSMGLASGDIDNDGDIDLYITQYGPDLLYRNNGDGTFSEIGAAAGINNPRWGCSAAFADFDGDGYLDIFVVNYVHFDPDITCSDRAGRPDYCGPHAYPGENDVLFINRGDGTFRDNSAAAGIADSPGKGLGITVFDADDDGDADVYVSNDSEANFLWINDGRGHFLEEGVAFGLALNENGQAEAGMGIALGDADGDGDADVLVAHLRGESNTLYRNDGGSFRDRSEWSGVAGTSLPMTGFGAAFLDADNDGDPELAVVNGRVTRGPRMGPARPNDFWADYAEPNLFYVNEGAGKFRAAGGLGGAFSSAVHNSRGLAVGDVDNDGGLDLLVMNEGGPARLLKNTAPGRGNWLMVRAVDPRYRRIATGARVIVYAGGKRLVRLVDPACGFLSAHDSRTHFGLGEAETADSMIVLWPDGLLERFPGVAANRHILLSRGNGEAYHD